MDDLICSRCGRISEGLEGFRVAMLMKLTLRKDYKRLKKFMELSNEQLANFYKLWKGRVNGI